MMTHKRDATLTRFSNDIGQEYDTVRRYRDVAKTWPQNAPRGAFSICRQKTLTNSLT